MSLYASLFVAVAVGAGAWLLLRRNLFEVLLGVSLFSQGANVLVLASGGSRPGARPPLIVPGSPETGLPVALPEAYADPVPHALVLTAIVIGFGFLSFLMLLIARGFEAEGTLVPDDAAPQEED